MISHHKERIGRNLAGEGYVRDTCGGCVYVTLRKQNAVAAHIAIGIQIDLIAGASNHTFYQNFIVVIKDRNIFCLQIMGFYAQQDIAAGQRGGHGITVDPDDRKP